MRAIARRLSVLGPSLLLGAFCTGLYAVDGLPSSWNWGARLEASGWMLTGPFFLIYLGSGPVPDVLGVAIGLGWLALPALSAHPIRPNLFTGILTVLGAFFWFTSGILTMITCVWGA